MKRANNIPNLPGIDYVAKNWALAMMLKALPLVHFWSVLLLKEQMMTSVRKTLKTLVWSAQNRLIPSEICPENSHKICRFFTDCFLAKFAPKIPAKSADFRTILSLKIPRNLTFFSATYQKPCLYLCPEYSHPSPSGKVTHVQNHVTLKSKKHLVWFRDEDSWKFKNKKK